MQHYKYRTIDTDTIVFECDASGILEADQQYKDAGFGDVSKQPHIGCSWLHQ